LIRISAGTGQKNGKQKPVRSAGLTNKNGGPGVRFNRTRKTEPTHTPLKIKGSVGFSGFFWGTYPMKRQKQDGEKTAKTPQLGVGMSWNCEPVPGAEEVRALPGGRDAGGEPGSFVVIRYVMGVLI